MTDQDGGGARARRRIRPVAEIDGLRVPPQSLEAEQAVLGGLLLDNSTWDAIADRLTAEDFYRRDHQHIFTAVAELSARSEPSDAVTLAEYLAAARAYDELARRFPDAPEAASALARAAEARALARGLWVSGSWANIASIAGRFARNSAAAARTSELNRQ
jgi:replicative DNA helicase